MLQYKNIYSWHGKISNLLSGQKICKTSYIIGSHLCKNQGVYIDKLNV